MKRRYLRPDEVPSTWQQYYDFSQQEAFKGLLHIRTTCPGCKQTRWQVCSAIRSKNVSPYCYSCSRINPLRPGDIDRRHEEYFDFDRQELRPTSRGNSLFIWTQCPECNVERWQQVSWLRSNSSGTPICVSCAHHKGPSSVWWRGGRCLSSDGYVNLTISGLPAGDQKLALATSANKRTVREHRFVVAKALGRPLTSSEIVHHRNSNRSDNRLANLRLATRGSHCTVAADEISNLTVDIEWAARRLSAQGTDVAILLQQFLKMLLASHSCLS